MPSSATKKRKQRTPAASTSTGKVRMVKKKAAGVLLSPPASMESSKKPLDADIRDIRLAKMEEWPAQPEVVGLCEGCVASQILIANNQIEIAALKTQLEAVTQRLEQLENQTTSIPPMLTSARPRPSCGRRLFVTPDSDEGNAELTISPACPHSLNPKKSTQLPDVLLRSLTAEGEETFYKECFQRGDRRPDVYAASVFMALCPFEAYQSWAKQVNWSGTNGKAKLPKNLKDKVHECVIQRFPDLTADSWFRVRSKINERLRSPRKLDPEQPRAGFSNNC